MFAVTGINDRKLFAIVSIQKVRYVLIILHYASHIGNNNKLRIFNDVSSEVVTIALWNAL